MDTETEIQVMRDVVKDCRDAVDPDVDSFCEGVGSEFFWVDAPPTSGVYKGPSKHMMKEDESFLDRILCIKYVYIYIYTYLYLSYIPIIQTPL